MRQQQSLATCFAIVVATSISSLAHAQSFNIDVGANPFTVPSSSYGAAAASPGYWNAFDASSASPQPLSDLIGSVTAVQLTIAGGLGDFAFDNPQTVGDDAALLDDIGAMSFVGGGFDVVTYTFTGIADGRYDVYTYAWAPDNPSYTTYTDATGGFPCLRLCGGGPWSGVYVAGLTYLKETVVVTGNQLVVTLNSAVGHGSCAAIQTVVNNSVVGTPIAQFDIGTEEPNPTSATTAWGRYWVSGANTTTGLPPHRISEYVGSTHAFIFTFATLTANPLTMVDHAGSILARINSAGDRELLVYDNAQGRSTYKYTPQSTAPPPYASGTLTQTFTTRGTHKTDVDLDPITGLYYSVSATGQIEVFSVDINGNIVPIALYPAPPSLVLAGLAIDYVSNVLWAFSKTGPCGGTTNLVEFVPLDPSSGAIIGPSFYGDMTLAGANVAMSCKIAVDPMNPSRLVICALQSGPPVHLVLYDLGVTLPSSTTFCTSGTTTNGCAAAISSSGLPSASASSGFNVNVTNIEGQKQGLIFYGNNNTGFTPLPWSIGSSSYLCVKPPTQRTGAQSTGGTINSCNGSMTVDFLAFLSANPGALGNPFSAGSNVYLQGWFRDPPAPKTTNLSDALQVTMQP